jgi:hypothetical protein
VAIAVESRDANYCQVCADWRNAQSLATIVSEHDSLGGWAPVTAEAIGRIVTDSGQIGQELVFAILQMGISCSGGCRR